jgi:hypothetical protein
MSDLAYFEYAIVMRPQGNQLEGTPAHYLVEVTICDPVTGKERDEEELKKLANDFLTLALGLHVQEITDFAAISESEAHKLKKLSPAGTHHDGRLTVGIDRTDVAFLMFLTFNKRISGFLKSCLSCDAQDLLLSGAGEPSRNNQPPAPASFIPFYFHVFWSNTKSGTVPPNLVKASVLSGFAVRRITFLLGISSRAGT